MKPGRFCQIVRGDAPAAVVYEDAAAVGFLDHCPVFPGHVLLAPRRRQAGLPGFFWPRAPYHDAQAMAEVRMRSSPRSPPRPARRRPDRPSAGCVGGLSSPVHGDDEVL